MSQSTQLKTKRLTCSRCQTSQIHTLVGDGLGGLRWKCPNCGMECKKTSEKKSDGTTPPQPTRYFLTVDWCKKGHRGIFCSKEGQCFRKEGEPHTQSEMLTILGPFWIILDQKSEPFTQDELAKFTYFRPLAEYTNQYGIALRKEVIT